jgi:hypothetical protein
MKKPRDNLIFTLPIICTCSTKQRLCKYRCKLFLLVRECIISMKRISSVNTESRSASQENGAFIYYRVKKRAPPDPVLSQMTPIQTSFYLQIHFNIILPSMPRPPKWSRPFILYNKYCFKPFLYLPYDPS